MGHYVLHGPEYIADPYPTYRAMAEESPVWLQPETGHVYISRYADVKSVLLDAANFSNNRVQDRLSRVPEGIPAQCLAAILHDRLVMTDGSRHRMLRVKMRDAFTAARVRTYAPMIQEVIGDHLDGIDWSEPVDFLKEIALPIPSKIILLVLGFPPADVTQLRQWTSDFYTWLASSPDSIEVRTKRAMDATEHMRDYVADQLRNPPAGSEDSLLGHLLQDESAGVLTDDEVVANLIGIVNAAHETTTSLMANSMVLLLAHPDQLRLLLSDPSLIPGAVAEVGRLESPSQVISRVAAHDLDLQGVSLRAGQLVAINLAQANRDPDVYPDPDRMDITRDGPAPLTFGHGEHFCAGTALARLEAEELITTLLPRLPGARILNEPIDWRPTPAFRCPRELLIQFSAP
ncbi:MAG: cytochrome P450 [Actinomycetales bacterium]|nr:cytochrome P450 [Actinomycetales bacterium]